jgi:WD repeat-containing protein 19
MRSEYRNQIDPKYVKKIEGIVRKAPKGLKDLEDDNESDYSPCPVCDIDLPNMETICFQCKTTLPICIATVRII